MEKRVVEHGSMFAMYAVMGRSDDGVCLRVSEVHAS